MTKTPEEKAREVLIKANAWRRDNNGIHEMPEPKEFGIAIDVAISVFKEVKDLREALKELTDASINTCDMQSYIKGEEIPEDAWDKNIDYLRDKAEQAKRLLNK